MAVQNIDKPVASEASQNAEIEPQRISTKESEESPNEILLTKVPAGKRKCDTCGESFSVKYFRSHERTHLNLEKILCPVCGVAGERYSNNNSLGNHIRRKHPNYKEGKTFIWSKNSFFIDLNSSLLVIGTDSAVLDAPNAALTLSSLSNDDSIHPSVNVLSKQNIDRKRHGMTINEGK